MEKFHSVGTGSAHNLETCQPHQFSIDSKFKICPEQLKGTNGKAVLPIPSWRTLENCLNTGYGKVGQPPSSNEKMDLNEIPFKNGLFSSSLPGMTLNGFTNGALFNQSIGNPCSSFEVDKPNESLKEIEDKTIGDLLPDDADELFYGVDDVELEYVVTANNSDDTEDDLFCSGGGIELEAKGVSSHIDWSDPFCIGNNHNDHPSRTLIVRNINNGIEDAGLRFIFEQYGDVHTLHTKFKCHGLVMVSYYDLRSACNASRNLQNMLLMQKRLDVRFSVPWDYPLENIVNQGIIVVSNIDHSVSNSYLHLIFGVHGEIKEIQDHPQKCQKLIEFYDLRAAEASIHALNRSIIAGKDIHLEPLRWHARGSKVEQVHPEFGPDRKGSPTNSSPSVFHVKVASAGSHCNQPGDDLGHSMGQLNSGFHRMPALHSHSFPDYNDGLVNNISNMASSLGLHFVEHIRGVDNRHTHGVNSSGVNFWDFINNEEALGASMRGNCHLQGHQYPQNKSPSDQCSPPGPFVWSNTSSHLKSISNHSHSQVLGFPRPPSDVMNTVHTLHHHSVGSAPAGNPSLWDRRAYKQESTETSTLHFSLRNMGFPGNSTMHPLELGSFDVIPRVSRSSIETSISSPHVGLPSHQNYHMFHCGRSPLISLPVGFESPNDRVKSQKSDPSSNQTDNKRQYELDIERIIRGEDSRTTLMIKNIPNKYTSKMLLATIDERHRGTYDFIYLPIDFKNKCNVGYAFINLVDHKEIIPFYKSFNGKKWEKFNSEKVASLSYARIQGKAALISHFQNSSLMNEDKRCRPILFHSDGPNAGDQEPFPVGMNIRSRSGRLVTKNSEESHHGSPSNSESGDGWSNGSNSVASSTDS